MACISRKLSNRLLQYELHILDISIGYIVFLCHKLQVLEKTITHTLRYKNCSVGTHVIYFNPIYY